MDIIVSHDVDHLYLSEHLTDTYIPGLLLRSIKGVVKGGISPRKLPGRFSSKLNRVKELRAFNKSFGIKETYFFGMRKGLNLSYHYTAAKPYIEFLLKEEGVLVGLHGMGYNNKELLKEEKERLESFLPAGYQLGIRNHYLRKDKNTLHFMSELGFAFDSTEYHLEQPRKIGEMWEIPISVMDAGFIGLYKNDFEVIKQKSLRMLQEAEEKNLPYFVINFHDAYFNEAYPDYKNWYEWFIAYLHEKQYRFVNFLDAKNKLNNP